jgi:hypothetical protein
VILERIFEVTGVLIGLALVGSCSFVSFASGGTATGILTLLISIAAAAVLVSAVFVVTRTSADVRAIRRDIERLEHAPGVKEDKGDKN